MSFNHAILSGQLVAKPAVNAKRTSIVDARLRTSLKRKDKTETFEVPIEALYDDVKGALLAMGPGDGICFEYELTVFNAKPRADGSPSDWFHPKITRILYHWPASAAEAGRFPKPQPEPSLDEMFPDGAGTGEAGAPSGAGW